MESVLGSGVYGPLNYFFVALGIAAFIVEAWAFVDAIIRPAPGDDDGAAREADEPAPSTETPSHPSDEWGDATDAV